ncbi:MAG: HD domain-containing protein [Deltaproteobacteria bacterium]|nr:HD domain-containing protein [Deltaproteobacteria bacterium]
MLDGIPQEVLAVCRRLREAGHAAFVVGGSIRDLLIGRAPGDFDVATSAHPETTLRLFGSRYALPTGLQHGTVTVLVGDPGSQRPVEVTTFRGEGAYLDGRRPSTVTFSATLEEDLSRRDFTINAIAYDPAAGTIIDPYDGRGDIGRKLVRTVGDPLLRFAEDGLRPMRGVRQAAQLGFALDAATQAAIPRTLGAFRKVSVERIRDELRKLLLAPVPSVGIEAMRRTGLLAEVLPEMLPTIGCLQNRFHKHDVYEHTLATLDAAVPDFVVRMAALLHDLGKPASQAPREDAPGEFSFFRHEQVGAEMAEAICARLKLPTEERGKICALVAGHMFFYTPDWTDGTVRRFVKRVGPDLVPLLFALREADIASRGQGEDREAETRELRERIAQVAAADAVLRVTDLAIDGKDVMRILGISPGRRVGEILEGLLEKVLDDPTLNQPETLARLVREAGAV